MTAPAATPRARQTRDRLIEAAGSVFAERGYRGATMREIAERAGANLAAAHYHFGSKLELYRTVVSVHFERLEARLAERGGTLEALLDGAPPRERVIELLRARLGTMLAMLLEPGGVHPTLMQRELSDPSEALPFIVARFIEPLQRDTARILARLAPSLDAASVRRCTYSVVGQAAFYLTHRAPLLSMMGRSAYPPGFADAVADHIVAFSLGGLAALEGAGERSFVRRSRRKTR